MNNHLCIDYIIDPWTNKHICTSNKSLNKDCGWSNGPYNCQSDFPIILSLNTLSFCNISNSIDIGILNLTQSNCNININVNLFNNIEIENIEIYVGKFPLMIDSSLWTNSTFNNSCNNYIGGYTNNYNKYPLIKNFNYNSGNTQVNWNLNDYLCGEFYLVAHLSVCGNPLAFH